MKKNIVLIMITASILSLAGYSGVDPQNASEIISDRQKEEILEEKNESEPPKAKKAKDTKESTLNPEKKIIEGFQLADGREIPVKVSMSLEKVQRGEEAYKILSKESKNIPKPSVDKEYIIFTFSISYDDGELDEIYMIENRASLESAGLYFVLSNGNSNAVDMTDYLSNSIYNLTISKDQNAKGEVAFLHKSDADEPLYFVGFGKNTEFIIEKPDNF